MDWRQQEKSFLYSIESNESNGLQYTICDFRCLLCAYSSQLCDAFDERSREKKQQQTHKICAHNNKARVFLRISSTFCWSWKFGSSPYCLVRVQNESWASSIWILHRNPYRKWKTNRDAWNTIVSFHKTNRAGSAGWRNYIYIYLYTFLK